MARERYEKWKPTEATINLVAIANHICAEWAADGYDLTLRQLYYQFVARGYIPNTERSYKNLGSTISRARMAGLLDWNYIVDRTRTLRGFNHSLNPGAFVDSMHSQYRLDHWQEQPERLEIWVEKEALVGVVARPAQRYDIDYFACKGYPSQSEVHDAAMRHLDYEREGQDVTVLHLGDHDPSGIDMTRDIADRLHAFGANTIVERLALNADQIEQYDPPPNPTKLTDSRAQEYMLAYGHHSWELDALTPAVIDALITDAVAARIDVDLFTEVAQRQSLERIQLAKVATHWPAVVAQLAELD